jgi:RNA polymerase sigma-70 factor (ECF subfamily)
MGDSPSEFARLMQRFHDGSEEAARELLDDYGPHIRRVVRRKLNQKLRSKFDSTDFVQDVWASFLADRSHRPVFDNPQALAVFLGNIAYNKVVQAFRQRVLATKYNVDLEQSLETTEGGTGELIARQPTPSQAAAANEAWDNLLKRQVPRNRKILELLRQGNTHQEIALELGLNEKTVRRLVRRISQESPS